MIDNTASSLGGFSEDVEEKKPEVIKMDRRVAYWIVGDDTYKMKLTTTAIGVLEAKYKCNLMALVTQDAFPQLGTMLTLIQAGMSAYDKGIKMDRVIAIYDRYTELGYGQHDLLDTVILPLYAVSGFLSRTAADKLLTELEERRELEAQS